MKKFLLAMAAMLISTPALADNTYADFEHWSVMYDDHDCTMITSYKDKSTLMLTYDVGKQSSWVMFSDPAIKSLNKGETKKLEVVFTNGTAASVDDSGWGSADFDVLVTDDGTRVLRKRFSVQMLDDFAKYGLFAVFYDDKVIESMPLVGSAQAVKSLRACATERFRANPSDPFE